MTSATMTVSPAPVTQTSWKMMLCLLFSLVIHSALLVGIQMIERSKRAPETVPLVNVTLIPAPSAGGATTPNQEIEQPVSAPSMRSSPRPSTSRPLPTLMPPIFSQPQPIRNTSALEVAPPLPTQSDSRQPKKRQILKDTLAADALFAQHASKMVKRKTVIETSSSFSPSMPALAVSKIPKISALTPRTRSTYARSSTAHPTRSRRLTATLPSSRDTGTAKIGVRHSVRPVYPRLAKEEGWEGTVLIKALVRTSGKPENITIQKSSGHKILDNAAVDAIRQWRFSPAKDGNFSMEKYIHIPLKFHLHH